MKMKMKMKIFVYIKCVNICDWLPSILNLTVIYSKFCDKKMKRRIAKIVINLKKRIFWNSLIELFNLLMAEDEVKVK